MAKHTMSGTTALILVITFVSACVTGTRRYPSEDTLTPGIFLELDERITLPRGQVIRPVYAKGIALTKMSEGWRPRLYHDGAGYCTIGYGHLVRKAPCDGTEPQEYRYGISEALGAEILISDLGIAQRGVLLFITTELTDGQYAALVDFTFNVGIGNFRESTLRKLVNGRQFEGVARQFSRWVMADGKVMSGLKTRRQRETELFFEGYPIDPRAAPPTYEEMVLVDIRKGE